MAQAPVAQRQRPRSQTASSVGSNPTGGTLCVDLVDGPGRSSRPAPGGDGRQARPRLCHRFRPAPDLRRPQHGPAVTNVGELRVRNGGGTPSTPIRAFPTACSAATRHRCCANPAPSSTPRRRSPVLCCIPRKRLGWSRRDRGARQPSEGHHGEWTLLILDFFESIPLLRLIESTRTGQQMAADPLHLVFPLPPRASADRARFRRQFCPKAEELPRRVKG